MKRLSPVERQEVGHHGPGHAGHKDHKEEEHVIGIGQEDDPRRAVGPAGRVERVQNGDGRGLVDSEDAAASWPRSGRPNRRASRAPFSPSTAHPGLNSRETMAMAWLLVREIRPANRLPSCRQSKGRRLPRGLWGSEMAVSGPPLLRASKAIHQRPQRLWLVRRARQKEGRGKYQGGNRHDQEDHLQSEPVHEKAGEKGCKGIGNGAPHPLSPIHFLAELGLGAEQLEGLVVKQRNHARREQAVDGQDSGGVADLQLLVLGKSKVDELKGAHRGQCDDGQDQLVAAQIIGHRVPQRHEREAGQGHAAADGSKIAGIDSQILVEKGSPEDVEHVKHHVHGEKDQLGRNHVFIV